MERPALQRLIEDIAAGRIDIVVAYKVDRLTRSLLDFAKLVEAFDGAGVSFVSVTQSFNTTSSMGRLALNMLLSFAQFEREVTAERIRDKIAACKQRGMWMGGIPPLGYEPNGRSLAIINEHAAIVRDIFKRYLELGNVRILEQQLEAADTKAPTRLTAGGKKYGGGWFSRGQLYTILKNPIYVGRIRHGTKAYAGQHEPIIESDLFDVVQARLADSTNGKRIRSAASSPSLLAGKLFDHSGKPLVATHATKGKVRYRYYISRKLQHEGDAAATGGLRIPAKEIEMLVQDMATKLLDDPLALAAELGIELSSRDTQQLFAKLDTLKSTLKGRTQQRLLANLVERIDIESKAVTMRFDAAWLREHLNLSSAPGQTPTISRTSPVRLKRTGLAMKLVFPSNHTVTAQVDTRLIKVIARGRAWWQQLKDDPQLKVKKLATRADVTSSYITRLVRLAFLSPAIVKRVLTADTPAEFSLDRILPAGKIPATWPDQANVLLKDA